MSPTYTKTGEFLLSESSDLPPLNALRAFEAAGRHLNFRAAADELGVTQGAIAQHVRGLEASLGVRLFERGPRGVSFTAVGRAYHSEVSDAFARLSLATRQLKPETSKVTISVTPTFASRWLIPNLPDFTQKHPEIDFRILSTERVLSFQHDGIDLAVRQGKPPPGAQLSVDLLFHQRVIAVASPSLINDQTLPLNAKQLNSLPLLHDTHNLWPDFLNQTGFTAKRQSTRNLHFSQTGLSVEAALSDQGVALVSRFLVSRDLAAGRLVQVVDADYTGQDDFYLLAQQEPNRQTATGVVRDWLLASADLTM